MGNLWPLTTFNFNGGYYYVSPSSGQGGYLTQAQWQASGVISGDDFQTVTAAQLSFDNGIQIGGQVYGVAA
jgi:hypothetical protein